MAIPDRTRRVQADNASRDRLRSLIERLSDAELAKPMPDGWTVAAVLAHMAFWDRRATVLVDRWTRERRGPEPYELNDDVGQINDGAKPQWLALQPRAAAQEVLAAAEAADRAMAAASPDLIEQMYAASTVNPSRADHRTEHLDQIEDALRS
jgi:uncharacterized damage-inducible protein DinB